MRHRGVAGALLVLVLLAVMFLSMAATSAAASGNADFLGTWNLSNGGIFTVTGQSSSGACTLEPGAEFSAKDCEVSGDGYSLTVVDADSSYESYNTGTIDGNTLTGSFTDTNGTTEAYTGTRVVTSTATAVACSQLTDGTANYGCTAVVSSDDSGGSAPSGTVDWSVPAGAFSDASCTLAATSASQAACSVVLTPTQVGNQTDETVTADFQGNAQFDTSNATATIPAVTLTVTAPATVDTYLDGSADATFKLTLSRASNTPVTVDYETHDGTGTDAAIAAEGDYETTNGTITFAPGTTTATIKVQCNADIKLRDTSDFDVDLSSLSGATFASTASAPAIEHARVPSSTPASTLTVEAKIKPDLRVGTVIEAKDSSSSAHAVGTPIKLEVKRYDTHAIVPLRVGDSVYVGDEIYTGKTTVAALEFLLGGKVGINSGQHVKVSSERSIDSIGGTLYDILKHKIRIIEDVEHREGPQRVQIQTSGGILSIKG
jgi:hypothetical protein